MKTRLSYLAPRREAVVVGEAEVCESVFRVNKKKELVRFDIARKVPTYTTRPWTVAGVMKAVSSGCVFGDSSQHDFEHDLGLF